MNDSILGVKSPTASLLPISEAPRGGGYGSPLLDGTPVVAWTDETSRGPTSNWSRADKRTTEQGAPYELRYPSAVLAWPKICLAERDCMAYCSYKAAVSSVDIAHGQGRASTDRSYDHHSGYHLSLASLRGSSYLIYRGHLRSCSMNESLYPQYDHASLLELPSFYSPCS